MADFKWRVHRNGRLNLKEAFGRQTTATDDTLDSASAVVSIFSGVTATKNTSTDFTISNIAISTGAVRGHDGFRTPPDQSVEFTVAPKSSVTGGRYLVKTQVGVTNSTEVLVELTTLSVDTKGAT